MNSIHLESIDLIIIFAILIIIIGVGIWVGQSSKRSLEGFFLGGRNIPWALAGLSMVATTFAADTPLAVTEIIGMDGVSGNWIWWNLLAGGMLTSIVFAPLWRRAGVVTEAELIELRYHGKPAFILRVFRAIYLGFFINLLILGWVHVAMISVLEGLFGIPYNYAFGLTAIITVLVAVYAALSGLLGVVVTDAMQFIIAMTGSIALAVFVIQSEEIGGLSGLTSSLSSEQLNFFSDFSKDNTDGFAIGMGAFFAYFGMMWWSTWYPGAEPGGGGYIAQRIMSSKNESHAVGATLFFNFAHYALRPWPWILVGLASLTLFNIENHTPDNLKKELTEVKAMPGYSPNWLSGEGNPNNVSDATKVLIVREGLRQAANKNPKLAEAINYEIHPRFGYIYAMKHYLPKGWMGLMLVALLSAYMSTISTQLNWGASYLINDVWLRVKSKSPKDEIVVQNSRWLIGILASISLLVSTQIHSISGVWKFIMECGAGLGLVLILRWFWGRINAWVEITATITPFIGYSIARYFFHLKFPNSFFFTVGLTTVAWLIVLFSTKESKQWMYFKSRVFEKGMVSIGLLFLRWILAVISAYSLLFGIGGLLLHSVQEGIIYLFSFGISGILLILSYRNQPIRN